MLSGTFTRERIDALDPADRAPHPPDFTTNLDAGLRTVDRLRTVARAHGTTAAAVALAWVLARRGVTGRSRGPGDRRRRRTGSGRPGSN
ncbi:aldo/keto reductase [Streptomyces puniciscabiei]|uniref:aldo/keto reductase n=1 Tax=Streptomyces puniciscabiei TaxID=164348 RepID=UPI0037AB97BD